MKLKQPEPATAPAPTFSHLLDLPRELRDLIWEHCLLAAHGPQAASVSDYRQYDSWGEESNHYPRRTHVNSTALLCCSHQVHAEMAAAIARLRAQRRLACSLRILLRNERHLFLDWTCVPAVATHYDSVDIEFKLVGKPERKGGGLIKTLHPSALLGRSSNSSSPPWSSILYERNEDDFAIHRHLFKMLARLRSYGPSFAGDPVIFSAISSSPSPSSHPHFPTSNPPPPPPTSSAPPRQPNRPRPSPTTITNLTFNVLTPPPSHTPPDSYRPHSWPWQSPRPQLIIARGSRDIISVSNRISAQQHQHGLIPPLCVAMLLREFVVWAVHGREKRRGAGGRFRADENAFLKSGVGGVAVLLDGAEVDVGDVVHRGGGGASVWDWWEPVLRGEEDGAECAEGGLHRYCRQTRELRMAAAYGAAGRGGGGGG